jgi:hypothetical protein
MYGKKTVMGRRRPWRLGFVGPSTSENVSSHVEPRGRFVRGHGQDEKVNSGKPI